ncbi:hypothetical protein FRC01_000175 [Tulasnella sp. 417]|nr:hypothetical protein FRC01_000175 [Tulasnella sp. 417]
MSSSDDFVDLEEAIIRDCTDHEQKNGHLDDYSRSLPFGDYFVKFGGYASFLPEVMTLEYVAKLASKDASAPRVPQVYHFFHRDKQMSYVVMEFIPMVKVSPKDLAPLAALAVRWMRGVPAPDDVVLGQLGDGRARHVIFKNYKAPLDFTSVEALERFFNRAVARLPPSQNPVTDISIANEPLVLTQSDMHSCNFGVDTAGRAVVLDAGDLGWLPQSLADYTLFGTTGFARAVAAYLYDDPDVAARVQQSPNLASMDRVKVLLWTAYPSSLGLDNDGYLPSRR